MDIRTGKSGFTLVELMLATAIMAIAVVSVFGIFSASVALIDMAGSLTQMTDIIRFQMDALYDINDFNSLDNFDGQSFDLASLGFTSSVVTNARGVYKIDPYNSDIKRATISISYRIRNARIIGEDANLNGALDGGEDSNNDNRLSSPVEATTLIVRKQL